MNVSKYSLLLALLGGSFLASCGSVQEAQRPIQYMAGLAPANPGGPVPGYSAQFADAYWGVICQSEQVIEGGVIAIETAFTDTQDKISLC